CAPHSRPCCIMLFCFYSSLLRPPPCAPLFPYTTLFRSSASVRKDLATEKLLPVPAPAARKPRTISETLSPGSGPSGIRALLAAGSPESSSMCPTGVEVGIDEQPTRASEAHTDRISIVTRDLLDLMLFITVLLRRRPRRSRPCRRLRLELPDRHPHRGRSCRH